MYTQYDSISLSTSFVCVLYDYIIWLYYMSMYCMAVFLYVAIIYDYHMAIIYVYCNMTLFLYLHRVCVYYMTILHGYIICSCIVWLFFYMWL